MTVQQSDLDFLSTNGYVSAMQKDEYDRAVADVTNLTRLNDELQKEQIEEVASQTALEKDEKKTHSIFFHFERAEKKEADLQRVQTEQSVLSAEQSDVAQKESLIQQLIQKKSMIDRMTPYDGRFLALTGSGVITLNDLNVRNYRVSDVEFSDFIEESRETNNELRSIAERGRYHVSTLLARIPKTDLSQLWSVSIGLAKLLGDPGQIDQRFLLALDILKHFDSTTENKIMAAEIMTASGTDSSSADSDIRDLSKTLADLDKKIRHDVHVPKQLSAGVASTIMAGRRFDGTFPTDRFVGFSRITSSFESAAILSAINVPTDQLTLKFQSYRGLFNQWGYQTSEDTELASACLSISDLEADEVKTKLAIVVDALKTYLEYPLVAGAILASIPTLEANETLDLMEKAYSLLGSLAVGLERSELLSLSVRMIHGIRNELVRQVDPTARITGTPIQFTYAPSPVFFWYHGPVIIAHSSYYSIFSGIGGSHPAHVHGVGGFSG